VRRLDILIIHSLQEFIEDCSSD